MMTSMTAIMERATELAQQNTPGVTFAKFGVFLENLFLGTLRLLGLIVGRTWFHASRTLFVTGLAFADGYKDGVKALPPAPPVPVNAPFPGQSAQLLDDPRTIDTYQTPFGVPYGPNVQASHD